MQNNTKRFEALRALNEVKHGSAWHVVGGQPRLAEVPLGIFSSGCTPPLLRFQGPSRPLVTRAENIMRWVGKEVGTQTRSGESCGGGAGAEQEWGESFSQAPLLTHQTASLEYMAGCQHPFPGAPPFPEQALGGALWGLSTFSVLVMVGMSVWPLEVHFSILEVGDWPCCLNPSTWHRAWSRALPNVLKRDGESQPPYHEPGLCRSAQGAPPMSPGPRWEKEGEETPPHPPLHSPHPGTS